MIHTSTNQTLFQTPIYYSDMPDLPQLYYNHASGWRSIPYWGQFFLRAGALVATSPRISSRLIMGCAIPTAAYAAPLAAAGVVASFAITNRFTRNDVVSRVEWLQSLKLGTPLLYRRDTNTLQKGFFEGWCLNQGAQFARIKTLQGGKEFINLPQTEVLLGVEQLSDPCFTLPCRPSSRKIVDDAEIAFLSNSLGPTVAREHVAYSRLDCLIVGSKEQFRREARDVHFSVEDTTRSFTEGTLNMLTRTRALLTDSSAYRSDILASTSSLDSLPSSSHVPAVVIFSGATGFLKWRHVYRSSNWIILLDRTESHFQEAVVELNQEYIQLRADEEPLYLPLTPSSGIEMMSYREAL